MARMRLAGGLAAAFAVLTVAVAVGWEVPGDTWLLHEAWSLDGLEAPGQVVDAMTGYAGVGVLAALLVAVPVVRGRARDGVTIAVAVGGAVIGNALLKRLVDRPRPELADATVSELSYPSGHAAATAALVLAVVLVAHGNRRLVAAGALVVLLTAAAQLVLGLHHPSDLLGGWLWAGAWTLAVWAATTSRHPRAPRRRSTTSGRS